jgi:tetratricopeptide (TPR) repeat protein
VSDDNVIHVDFARGHPRRPPPHRAQAAAAPAEARNRDPLGDLYTMGEVVRLFGLSAGRLRHWERTGFLARSGEADGRRCYTFQDLISIRAAKELLDEGVTLRGVRRCVEALRESLPKVARPLGSLRIVADGQSLVVKDERVSYEPATGQLTLDFGVSELRDDVVRVLRGGDRQVDTRHAYEHYLEGCRLDEDDDRHEDAERAYRRAIELDPSLANAFTNLGNLMVRRGRSEEAERLYTRALQVDPDQPEAYYNLGFLMYDQGNLPAAVLNFKRALRSDPSFADAHFNLAMALADMNRRGEAREHWDAYLRLDPASPWAEVARRELERS